MGDSTNVSLGQWKERVRGGDILPAYAFDDGAYRRAYPDVEAAILEGLYVDGYEHFMRHGRWEGRVATFRPGLGRVVALGPRLRAAVGRLRSGGVLAPRLSAAGLPIDLLPELEPKMDCNRVAHPVTDVLGAGMFEQRVHTGSLTAVVVDLPPGFYMLALRVDCRLPADQATIRLHHLDGLQTSEHTIGVRSGRIVRRLIEVDAPLSSFELMPGSGLAPCHVRHLHLRRVRDGFARSRLLRRVQHHHPALGEMSAPELQVHFSAQRSSELLWAAYEETFVRLPPPRVDVRTPQQRYATWLAEVEAPQTARFERTLPERLERMRSGPVISILLPTYETDERLLQECLESVVNQSYPRWQLCIADDASVAPHVRRVLERFAKDDARIRVHFRDANGHISRASNDALALASGEWIALLDHDDVLPKHALLYLAQAIVESPAAQVIYGDEDKLDEDGGRCDPHFKPDWNPDLLYAQNYMGHLLAARTARVRDCGGFRVGLEGSQDHDLVLRLTADLEPAAVVHIPEVLYHWRKVAGSTAAVAEAKPYTVAAGVRAVQDALNVHARGATSSSTDIPNCYRVSWPLPGDPPRVSIMIPTRDALQLVRACVESVLAKTTYPNFELIVVDNGSVEAETLAYFEHIGALPQVRVIRSDAEFNFAALNNLAARSASGTILCMLNNDVEVIEPRWLTEMVSHAIRPGVGCVGAQLLFPNDTIQHAGVIVGLGGVAGHAHQGLPAGSPGYYGRAQLAHVVSAVTAACMVVQRSAWEEVGGLDEERFKVAFNDVDLCLRLKKAGYRNIYTPYALLYHHESATRGDDMHPERRERFQREIDAMRERWGPALQQDPHYSPHLSLDHADFTPRTPG